MSGVGPTSYALYDDHRAIVTSCETQYAMKCRIVHDIGIQYLNFPQYVLETVPIMNSEPVVIHIYSVPLSVSLPFIFSVIGTNNIATSARLIVFLAPCSR